MNIEVKGVHHDVDEETKELINKKLKRLEHVSDLIVDLLFTITLEKQRYKIEVTTNFRWGNSSHIKVTTFDLFKGIDLLFDKLDNKIHKEKGRIQEKQ